MYTTGHMATIEWERITIQGFWENPIKEIPHPELKKIFVLPTREEAARFAAEKILEVVTEKPDAAISWPSGRQGNSVIEYVVRLAKERNVSFENAKFFHLDEYFPISATDKNSLRNNLRENLFEPLGIKPEQIFTINADFGRNGDEVASEYENLLKKYDIDLVLHPIGPDGHMAFNEAGTPRDSLTHKAKLLEKTIFRDHITRGQNTPEEAITQGIATILRAKKILFINFDPAYQNDLKNALYDPISENNPSSFLRTAREKVEVVTTQEIAKAIGL